MDKLDNGPFYGNLSALVAPDFSITKVDVNSLMKYTMVTEDNRMTFSFSAHESSVPIRAEGIQLTEKSFAFHAPGYETSGITFPGSVLYGFRISPAFIHEKHELLEVTEKQIDLEKESFFKEASLKHLNEIRGLLANLFSRMNYQPSKASIHLMVEEFKEDVAERLICQLYNDCPDRLPPPPWTRRRVVRQTIELLESYRDFPISIPAICKMIGTSERSLRYAFADHFGVSPKQYLQTFRLNRARRHFQQTNMTESKVIDIANHWGFSHMGKFSGDYKRLFGESPSETLKKPRL